MTLPRTLAVCIAILLVASSGAVVRAAAGHPAHPGLAAAVKVPSTTLPPVLADPSTTARVASTTSSSLAARAAERAASHARSGPVQADGAVAGPSNATAPDAAPHQVVLPTPTEASLPAVAASSPVRTADALVMLGQPISPTQLAAVRALHGLSYLETVDTGTVKLGGQPVVAFGVDPGTFRAFTPSASAASARLWQYLAGGALVSSYEMATDRKLQLGSEQTIGSATAATSWARGWLGAFASIGLPGVDLLVADSYAGDLGLAPASGLVVSAPNVAGQQLLNELHGALPGAGVELLRSSQLGNYAGGSGLGGNQREAIIAAALSKVGSPYVWGGDGPSVFDCSGLVQWSFAQAGILMPRTAAEQFLTGVHIPLALAQPGDLLFWTYDPNDPGFVDHTAIYLGDGLMVVAPHTGTNVQVVSVPTNEFAGAVQVLLKG